MALDDALPMILWCFYFIEAKGYTVEQNIVFQDNQLAMRLAINGSMSSLSCTKHIKARYYFVKDKVEEGEFDIKYCLTKKMQSDILNHPKQGSPFRKERAMLMNAPVEYDDGVDFLKTNPALLPDDKMDNLGALGINRSCSPSRSVLEDISNRDMPGVLQNEKQLGGSRSNVRWSGVVRQQG